MRGTLNGHWECSEVSAGGCCVQFPDAAEYLLLGHLTHLWRGRPWSHIADECLIGGREVVLPDEDCSEVGGVVFAPHHHWFSDRNGLVQVLLVLAVGLPITRCFDHLVQHLLIDRHGPIEGLLSSSL